MMYNDKLVVAVKANGRILREQNDTVFVPFGTEYTLLIKNLSGVRACLDIEIDGDNITDSGLMVNAGETLELERSIKNGNLLKGNRFKFIERTGAIESGPRGIKLEDGLIRVAFEFEKQKPVVTEHVHHHYDVVKTPTNVWPYPSWVQPYPTWVRPNPDVYYIKRQFDHIGAPASRGISGLTGNSGEVKTSAGIASYTGAGISASAATGTTDGSMASYSTNVFANVNNANANSRGYDPKAMTEDFYFGQNVALQNMVNSLPGVTAADSMPGITVAGSVSNQTFVKVDDLKGDGVKHTMVLKLMGEVAGKPVKKAVTVKHKPICTSCGKVNKPGSKFCAACGTGLEII